MKEIKGKVFTGMGVAREYLELQPYQDKIEKETGFRPFPGTLNINSSKEEVQKVLQNAEASRIKSFKYRGTEYSGIDIYDAEIKGLKAAVIRMDITDYGPEIIEVIAEHNLREELGLEDGDEIKIFIH